MNRRTFLAATLGTGVAAKGGIAVAATGLSTESPYASKPASESAPLSRAGKLTKADLPTPALLVDLDAFESNLQKMAAHCKQAGCGFRPHAKTHKCPEVGKRQIAAGALGICVATVPEAEAMVRAGIRGVLLTSPILEQKKIGRMLALASGGRQSPEDTNPAVLLAIGHSRQAELLSEAAEAAARTIHVLIDIDVGDRRTGILPGKPALELAQIIAKHKSLRLRGVQAYAGHASHAVGFENRQKVSREAMGKAVETRDLLKQSGIEAAILSGGSTGTYNIDSDIKGVSELQVGSFVFMDQDYRRIGGKSGEAYTDFQRSLTVLTTVVSATHADRVTIDAGIKAFATDVTYKPEAKDQPGLVYDRGGDEFGILTAKDGAKLPKLGDRLEFFVPHCDPTVNLYDRIHAVRGDKVESIWPVLARKE